MCDVTHDHMWHSSFMMRCWSVGVAEMKVLAKQWIVGGARVYCAIALLQREVTCVT